MNNKWIRENYYVSNLVSNHWNPFGNVIISRFEILKVINLFLSNDKRPALIVKLKINNDMDELGLILEKSSKAATQYESKIKTVKGFMHEDYTVAKLKEDKNI